MIVVHDPQPLGLTTSRRDRSLLCISLYGFVVLPEDLLQRNRLFNALQEIVAENLSTPSPRAPHRLPPPLAPQLNHATAPQKFPPATVDKTVLDDLRQAMKEAVSEITDSIRQREKLAAELPRQDRLSTESRTRTRNSTTAA